ncbi:DNA-binding transcriptional repressor [Escherichia coli]|uniref:DNA-binding transcriptional repressor n=1 Tax=Escherichia coli TaxID=562 RepID=A0A376L4G5_ECOLX|nr:DNA-binding transcriptional repressor [Escherichia coli]
MKDVARLAGVSTSTVSHVINKDRFVSEAISAKVEAAIKETQLRAISPGA